MCIRWKLWPIREEIWFRDVDSNHDTQLQRLMSYRLDDPGTDTKSVAEARKCAQAPHETFLPPQSLGNVRATKVSAKLIELLPARERCPSGLRSTLGKRV
jgi:hypothetical protein